MGTSHYSHPSRYPKLWFLPNLHLPKHFPLAPFLPYGHGSSVQVSVPVESTIKATTVIDRVLSEKVFLSVKELLALSLEVRNTLKSNHYKMLLACLLQPEPTPS